MKQLIIMRGLPGSGKSTLARTLGGKVYAADDFWMKNGKYCMDLSRILEAHLWNQNRVRKAMSNGEEIIIIDNTNVLVAHMQPYMLMAKTFGYEVLIREPDTPWAKNPVECSRRTIHGVRLYAIERMLQNWEEFPS